MRIEPKVVIEERALHGSDGHTLQRFGIVYIGQEEFRIYAPPKATGNPLEWLEQLHVRQSNGMAELEIQGVNRAYLIQSVRQALTQPSESAKSMTQSISVDDRKVFVVYGRNSKARIALFDFLRAINLDPLEWGQVVKATGKPTPFIGEALEAGFAIAQAAVVLLTGEDMARVGRRYLFAHDPTEEKTLTPQTRLNVLFEGGMAFGKYPERTVLVSLGSYRKFSDIDGRHLVQLSNKVESRQALADRLSTAGCAVVTANKSDWHTRGDFESAVEDADLPSGKDKTRLKCFNRVYKFDINAQFKRKIWIEPRNETDECLALRNARWKHVPSGIHATIRAGTFQLQLGNTWCPEDIGTAQLTLPPGELCRLWAEPDDAVTDDDAKKLCKLEPPFGSISLFANGEEITVPV
jgi:predicted nucleotide-binding protein